MLTILFDMDGVLAQYEKSHYLVDPMRHETKGSHYFYTRPPIRHGISLYHELKAARRSDRIGILSAISRGECEWEQFHDKLSWLKNMGIESDTTIITTREKVDAACLYLGIDSLDGSHVLIDDFNSNLISWKSAGGTAIKFLNGGNDPESFDGDACSDMQGLSKILERLDRT